MLTSVSSLSFLWVPALLLAFAPGLLAAIWLFPRERGLWQAAVGGALSLALLGGLALGLSYLPGGITGPAVALVLAGLTVGLSLLLLGTRPAARQLLRGGGGTVAGRLRRRGLAAGLFSAAVALAFLALTPGALAGQKESFTQFYLLQAAAADAPWRHPVALSAPVTVTFAVASSEQQAESFTVEMVSNGTTLATLDLGQVAPGARVERVVTLPARTSAAQQYSFFLHKGAASTPYRKLSFWVKTTDAFSASFFLY